VKACPAVFLDRDGVLNELVADPVSGADESPLNPDDVRLIPGAAEAVRELAQMGFLLVCVSNQPAAAKGRVTVEQLYTVHARVEELLATEGMAAAGGVADAGGVALAASRLCLHHPDGVVPSLSIPCTCRKPAPGMLLDAAHTLTIDLSASWMVGDTDSDVGAGRAAGARTLLIEHASSAHKRLRPAAADLLAGDLVHAARLLRDAR
jgi:D-glycero-D-manno-heptose 1,7-bisphosphate phosphatase